jgi:translation initiation factor IF-2
MSKVLEVTEYVSTGELAALMDVPVTDVITTLFSAGMMVSINQRLDADTITIVADEYGYEIEFITEYAPDEVLIEADDPDDLEPRAPIVTIMGHVDHGKTSLLDYIRQANVVSGEAGGITQHIGAYHVSVGDEGKSVGFLDTPGHEAFTAMRARGAMVTDVVILVVSADDAVMPQTIEAINHAKAAGVPIVVAVNKIDKPNANAQKVMQQLSEQDVLVEQYGGEVQCALVSAKTGEGVPDLLDKVLIESELLDLKANPDRNAVGTVIESYLDKGRGVVATIMVQNGTLEVGDTFIVGNHYGRVRAMFDERDRRVQQVGPSRPALVLGFHGQPDVGDQLIVMDDERETKEIAQRRGQIAREQSLRQRKHITLDEIGRRLALGDFQELNIIVKADVGGSVEALGDSLLKLSTEEVAVNIVHSGVGAITESDVSLATASDAVIIGFQVRPNPGARHLAEQEDIDIRTYSIIYNAISDVRDALEGLLSPEESEKIIGVAEVRETFKVPKLGTIGGCRVTEGRIHRNDKLRIIRDGVVIYNGTIASLRRFKDDVREVQSGFECGIGIQGYNDIKVGDQFESYEIVETKRTLEAA